MLLFALASLFCLTMQIRLQCFSIFEYSFVYEYLQVYHMCAFV